MTSKLLTFGHLLLFPLYAFPHGEDKPGPHGGIIQMPGAFHTEVVPDGKNKVRIYLLDMNWQNPSLKGKVEARIGKNKANCATKADHFSCTFPKKADLTLKGTLFIQTERGGLKGAESAYELPLRHKASGH